MSQKSLIALHTLPPDYTVTKRLEITSWRLALVLNLAGIVPLSLGAVVFFGVDRVLVASAFTPLVSIPLAADTRFFFAGLAVVLVIVMLSFHELCHGLAFQSFGARPRYGVNVRKAVAYARADQYYLPRNAYLIVALAPLVFISILTVILMVVTGGGLRFIIALMGAANAGGATGDLWFTVVCLRYPKQLLVRDFGDGAELFVPTHLS